MDLVRVGVVGHHEGSREMLERRVGGILKNIASVRALPEKSIPTSYIDLIVAHSYGGRVQSLEDKFKNIKVIGIELVLLPIGVRKLVTTIKKGERIGIIAEHLQCANYLMSEIIKSGVAQAYFCSGTFNQMESIDVDRFIVAEEMVRRVPKKLLDSPKLLMVPRMISPHSSSQLIHSALKIANDHDLKDRSHHMKISL